MPNINTWTSEYVELSGFIIGKLILSKIFSLTDMDKYMKNDKIRVYAGSYIHRYFQNDLTKEVIKDLELTSAADYFDFY